MLFDTLDASTVVLIAASIAFLIVLLTGGKRYKNLPPGPPALPIVGHMITFMRSKLLFKDLAELSKKYGDVMTVKFGTHNVFILNGYDMMKEAIVDKGDQFNERPRWMHNVQIHSRQKSGIIFHEDWRQRRRFVLTSMRDFGLGKRSLEERMVEEARFLTEEIAKTEGQPTDLTLLMPYATANIVCSVIIGYRFSYGDESFMDFLQTLNSLVRGSATFTLENFVPFCKYLPSSDFKFQIDGFSHILGICAQWKKEHEENFDPENLRDLVDLFIGEQRKDVTKFNDEDLVATIMELYIAGTETTSTTLAWALLFMLHNPEIQDRCRQEIHEVIGTARPPVYADIKNTPYVNAVMNEVQRVGNIIPLGIWHCSSTDAELAGYIIPKDHILVMNMDTALKDPKYWTDPHTFNPDRWLDADGKLIKNPAFIPFSMGKRMCLGEQLARKEYYIFLTTMVQKFKFMMEDENAPPSVDGIPGTVHGPGNYKLRAIKV